ncbi:hypothetical protein [Streptomyces sp. SID5643]|uniref:hypothetical protein n=1 Tax=Streptomyces sp. SID5643 TaxID=2690307 RepID=UPI00136D0833|nr:hypothetical protein [Streptomyces sp. SID5643]MZF87422.1 hypothetical protein [Streptomyces sp. SID5643]
MGELGIAVPDAGGSGSVDRGTTPWSRPWSSGSGSPVDGTYVCPRSLCGREQVREPGEELPVCHLHAEALTFLPQA